ncbi:hypothetical protein HZA97_04435 [Candidatus Woesearchaeota archaeon]|nr:hypothetical protein [Candidatus Woesearchaeota archaeon]
MFTHVFLKSTFVALSVIPSVAVGAYCGYCESKGIPLSAGLEKELIYGPAVIQGIAGGAFGAFCLYALGGGMRPLGPKDAAEITLFGAVPAAGAGAIIGGLETAVGYCLGYVAGKVA